MLPEHHIHHLDESFDKTMYQAYQNGVWQTSNKKWSKTQKGGETEYLLNDGGWITESKWNNALKLRKQSRETKENREILDRGHIKDVE